MTAGEWLAIVSGRGGTCRLDVHGRVCIRPSRALTPALRAAFPALQATLVAVLKERASTPARACPGATLEDVLASFPGARVVAEGAPAPWPPPGGWLPSPTRAVDPYGPTSPAMPCPTCGSSAWHRAGAGWTCARCHPPAAPVEPAEQGGDA